MNSELMLWDQPVSPVQTSFNWDETFAETKKLVEEDAELTATIDDAMVKRFHGRVQIGFNLMALQKEHSRKGGGTGDFTTVELPKLGITDRTFAHRCIRVAKLFQTTNVASLQHSDLFDLPMPMDTWNQLASPSGQTVVKQLESGEIKPTQEDIKKALEEEKAKAAAEKQRAEQLKQELEAEQKAYSLFKQEVEANEQAYTALVQSLEQQLQEKPEPEKVIEYQDTLETAAKVATLEKQIKELEDKPDIPPEKQQELDKLQQELKDAQTQLDFYTTQNEALAKEIEGHREAAGRSLEDATALAGRLRIRQVWQYATDEIQAALRKFHTRVPSEIDRESFENEERTRTYQTIEILEQTTAMLKKTLLSSNSTVDAQPVTLALSPQLVSSVVIGIPPEYQSLFADYQQAVLNFPLDQLQWSAPDHQYTTQTMTRAEHIKFTKELLSSRVDRRIQGALEAMKRTLDIWEG